MAYDEIEELLCVHIHDTGKGISNADMPKLFSMFGKLRRTADQNNEGNGMGLMICQKLVRLNGGTISVHSKGKNCGTVISFTMNMKVQQKTPTSSISNSNFISPDIGCTKMSQSFSSLSSEQFKKKIIVKPKLLVNSNKQKMVEE